MTINDFDAFYAKVHAPKDDDRFEAFPWQRRLVRKVCEDRRWPEVVALPTSAGKTSVIDIAVFLLALEASLPVLDRIASLRTFFVIDRRVVVDEAMTHARTLADALRNAKENGATGVVREVADALCSFGVKEPLKVVALRGGMYMDQTWADEPNQPLVCVSTVDQVGSRLLFRGYQLSELQRPVHAGLIGTDSLVIVDEAHLSTAFCDTVHAIKRYQARLSAADARPLQFLRMSATLEGDGDAFGPDTEDYANKELGRRWSAHKNVELREPGNFEEEAARAARALAKKPRVDIVAVVVNRVGSARSIFEKLPPEEAVLLTGRIRSWDRDRLMETYMEKLKHRASRQSGEKLFVVTTQTIEVGANFDFDAMVSEAAPLDALRQRLGRLDRYGELESTEGAILLRKQSGKDPIYGAELGATWAWLKERSTSDVGRRVVDFGILSMDEMVRSCPADGLLTARSRGPLIFPAHIETWVQTSPTPDPDPDVAPFLHGAEALDTADVQIVWRADLPEDAPDAPETWAEIVALAPPMMREALPVPIGAARRWLNQTTAQVVTDLEGAGGSEEDKDGTRRRFLAWLGPERSKLDYLYPGATIIVPATYGGCDEYGWRPSSRTPVRDIGDLCALEAAEQGRCRARVRAHADVLGIADRNEFVALMCALKKARESGDSDAEREALVNWLKEHGLNDAVLRHISPDGTNDDPYPRGEGFVVTAKRKKKRVQGRSAIALEDIQPEETDDGDESSWVSGNPRSLQKHTDAVVRRGVHYARHAGLSENLIGDITLALRMHDLGKCDERFQAMLHEGSLAKAQAAPEPLAKSEARGQTPARLKEWQRAAGYPMHARHEFVSAALAGKAAALATANDRELVAHLIGTHHGYGRPFAPFWSDDSNGEVCSTFDGQLLKTNAAPSLHRLDSGWTDQFWKLVDRYGFWGLAWLEAIMRRADCVQSRDDEEK